MIRLLVVVSVLLWAGAAAAQSPRARSIEDCEKIRSAHEYNLCLAAFSPRVGQRRARVRGSASQQPVQEPVVEQRRRAGRSATRAGGRQSATFDVRSGRTRATTRR